MHQPTDREIQHWVQERHGFFPTSAWIAHCRRLCGLTVENLSAYQQSRFEPCPLERQDAIIQLLAMALEATRVICAT